MVTANPKYRWFQFSLRTFTLAILVFGISLGWYTSRARRQEKLYRDIYRSNSFAYFDYQVVKDDFDPSRESWAPAWLRRAVSDDLLHSVVRLRLADDVQNGQADVRQVDDFCQRLAAFPRLQSVQLDFGTDERLIGIGRSTQLQRLEVIRGPAVTSRGIEGLKGLTRLRHLDFRNVQVPAEGYRVIGSLQNLEILNLGGEKLTDEAIALLAPLKHLRELRGDDGQNRITDAGLKKLSEFHKLEVLHIEGTSISDNGLAHLAALSGLRDLELGLQKSCVTNEGIAHLAKLKSLERLVITQVLATEEGLLPLATLPRLADVQISGPRVENGEALRKAMTGRNVWVGRDIVSVAY